MLLFHCWLDFGTFVSIARLAKVLSPKPVVLPAVSALARVADEQQVVVDPLKRDFV
jgi:hypothetical protein